MIKLLKTNNDKILKALREKRGNMNRETKIKIKKQKQKKTSLMLQTKRQW